jgi:hypothetical protein
MHKAALLLLVTMIGWSQAGCGTSCGKREDPLLWSDGTITERSGVRVYETTPTTATWLHFPSYRRFKLPHGFGTMAPSVDTWVSLAVDRPVSNDGDPQKFATNTAAEVLVTIPDENTLVVENATCENDYYLYVRITDKAAVPADSSQ